MAFKQNSNPFKKTSSAAGFDPSGVEDELKNNPRAMMSKDFKTVQMGPTSRDATLKDQRAEYQRRIKVNQANKRAADGLDFEYTVPHTGEVRRAKGALSGKIPPPSHPHIGDLASKGANISTNTPDINVGGGSGNKKFGEKAGAPSGRGGGSSDKHNARKRKQLARRTRQANRKADRQKKRDMHGGFLRRLIDKIF